MKSSTIIKILFLKRISLTTLFSQVLSKASSMLVPKKSSKLEVEEKILETLTMVQFLISQ